MSAARLFSTLALFSAGALLLPGALAADDPRVADIEARYQSERTACERAPASQDQTACLREAAAARDEARRGILNGASDYQKNALARCDALPAAERDNCIRRVRGEGETRGSVTEGGIYREYRELTIGPKGAPPSGK